MRKADWYFDFVSPFAYLAWRRRAAKRSAVDVGIFGVPTAVIDGELFCGANGMDLAKACLAAPGVLHTAGMRRVAGLPVGAVRKPV